MASITAKKIKGHTYYYARVCKRVDGKPRIVWQKYLGTADDIIERSDGAAPEPKEVVLSEFGAPAALQTLIEKLDVVEIINRHAGKRNQGVSVGEYLVIAAVSRALLPLSKSATARWFSGTILARLYPHIEDNHLTSQRFWDHMDKVPLKAIAAMEEDITARLLSQFDIDLGLLVYDTTNFFTWIDTFNERCSLPQRGHSKAKRGDLRQVSLAMLVSADYHIPLFHKLYEGNVTDRTSFLSITEELVARYRALRDHVEDITIVFDKGNNSDGAMEKVDDSPYHFVGSLVPSHHKDLLSIPRDEANYQPLEAKGLPVEGWNVHRTQQEVLGAERTIVITYNEKLYITQLKTISRELGKAKGKLDEIQKSLAGWRAGKKKGGKKPTVAGARKKVETALCAQHMKKLIEADVSEEEGLPRLRYRVSQKALSQLSETTLGKKILFTDNHEWSTEQIVAAYHSQAEVEEAFKRMKRPHFTSFSPAFHWTDQKLEVHAFCCVLALSLTSLLYRQANKAGIDISLQSMMSELSGIMEVAILYPESKRGKAAPKPVITISSMNKTQKKLFELFGLERYRF